jgi:protein-tyrosine phosphatase
MAEGIFTDLLRRQGLLRFFSVSSAGTVSYQSGSLPDFRAVEALYPLGIDISSIRASGIDELDLSGFDWIFVMDYENYGDIIRLFPSSATPKVYRMMEFVEERSHEEIQDPYYGSAEDFKSVMNDILHASEMILNKMIDHYSFLEQEEREH